MPESPIIHKHRSSADGALINAYLVEAIRDDRVGMSGTP
jgi:hypothetical protein